MVTKSRPRKPLPHGANSLDISGQFLLTLGTLFAVIISFIAAASIAGLGARPIFLTLIFILFFTLLFIPISIAIKPLIETDTIEKYLDNMEKRVKKWEFQEDDLNDLKRLKHYMKRQKKMKNTELFHRVIFVLSEMEKIDRARTDFYWDKPPEGSLH
jgi:hypothetical protein